jgi:hypothetical protein
VLSYENFVALKQKKHAETPYPCMQAVKAAHACKAAHASKADLTHDNAPLMPAPWRICRIALSASCSATPAASLAAVPYEPGGLWSPDSRNCLVTRNCLARMEQAQGAWQV